MPVTGAFFGNRGLDDPGARDSRDIHLMPGLVSPRLDQLLFVEVDGAQPKRRADEAAAPWKVGFAAPPNVSAPAISVDPHTGEVTVVGPRPTALHSFIITATVTMGTSSQQARIRVHVHDSAVDVWLTPSSLTVRQGAHNMSFSVLAKFNDGVIGDISNWSMPAAKPTGLTFVHRVGSPSPMNSWSTPAGGPTSVDPATGEITSSQASGSQAIQVQVDTGGQGRTASATVKSAPAWSTKVTVTKIAGLGFSAMTRTDIRNVLFLPDGFTASDKSTYDSLVRQLVNARLNANSLTMPYDVLKDKFNYFSAWVPSPQDGCSGLAEYFSLDPPDAHGNITGHKLESPVPWDGNPNTFELEQTINFLGLPTPAFDASNPATDAAANNALKVLLQQINPLLPASEMVSTLPDWRDRSTRVLLNERDTAFHMCNDARPSVDVNDKLVSAWSTMGFNPLRLTVDDFDTFLHALQGDTGTADPSVWAKGGKDARLVVFICRTNEFGGSNNKRTETPADGRYMGLSLDSVTSRLYKAATHGFDPTTEAIGKTVQPHVWATVAHEVAHSFSLDDEYGGPGKLATDQQTMTFVQGSANVQERAALFNTPAGTAVHVKWNWKRLSRAGVLAAPAGGGNAVTPDQSTAGQFLLSLEPKHAAAFTKNDIIRLRKRGVRDDTGYSERLQVQRVDTKNNVVVAKLIVGTTFGTTTFVAGDVVALPLRANPQADPHVSGDDLTLVHTKVTNLINTMHNPLNAKAADPASRPCTGPPPNTLPPIVAANLPVNLTIRGNSWQVVGLYEGGHGFDCDIYHPTGLCIMNAWDPTTEHKAGYKVPAFCTVCRYAMVDLIDPSKHGRIDDDYKTRYPK